MVQYRARKQAVIGRGNRLLTRAVLYQCPNVVWFDLGQEHCPLPISHCTLFCSEVFPQLFSLQVNWRWAMGNGQGNPAAKT